MTSTIEMDDGSSISIEQTTSSGSVLLTVDNAYDHSVTDIELTYNQLKELIEKLEGYL